VTVLAQIAQLIEARQRFTVGQGLGKPIEFPLPSTDQRPGVYNG
jgi:hypothetical protein